MTEPRTAAPPTDDERMRAALELAAGHPSPAARAMAGDVRTSAPRWTLVAAAIAAVVFLVGVGSGKVRSDVVAPVPAWRATLSWGLLVAAGLGAALLAVAFIRSGVIGRWKSSPLRVLTQHQRDQLRLQIDGEEAVVARQLTLTRMMVTDSLRGVPNFWWWLPTIAVFLAGDIRSPGEMRWLVTALVIAVSVRSVIRHRRRTQHRHTFLDLHTPDVTPERTT